MSIFPSPRILVTGATGLSDALATLLASSRAAVAGGALFDGSRDLSRLLGRPTTTVAVSVGAVLAGLGRQGAPEAASLGAVREIFHPEHGTR